METYYWSVRWIIVMSLLNYIGTCMAKEVEHYAGRFLWILILGTDPIRCCVDGEISRARGHA